MIKFSSDIQRRRWEKKDADGITLRAGETRHWYGRRKEPGRPWQWVKLFTDKRASQRRWEDLRRQSENRQSGILAADVEKLDAPIAELKREYIGRLKLSCDPDHVRISEWMLDRLVELGAWTRYADITVRSMTDILATLEADGTTASYRNKFIRRAKAFVTAFLPDTWIHPLKKLRRIREKGAKRTRARRAADHAQLAALLSLPALPVRRELAYALASRNGLRRNEARRLGWEDVVTGGPIPFFRVRRKQGHDDTPDCIAIHPYVLGLLEAWRAESGAGAVLPSVPDLKTLIKDWTRAGVDFIDDQGRRLDYHALRHTFQTDLDRTGCSRATKKKLMRHAAEDVTDGYAHAELAEQATALNRLPAPELPQDLSSACPAPEKDSGLPAISEGSAYPTWVLGRVFRTLVALVRQFKLGDASSCQVTTGGIVLPPLPESVRVALFTLVSAIPRPNVGETCPTGVQRDGARPIRYYRYRGQIRQRIARPVNTRRSDAMQRHVRRLIGGSHAL